MNYHVTMTKLSWQHFCCVRYYAVNFLSLIFSTEGTTTNGDFLLPFKTGAFLAKAPVLPVILRYPYERFSPAWDSISGVSVS